jgi:hypothetical protein
MTARFESSTVRIQRACVQPECRGMADRVA